MMKKSIIIYMTGIIILSSQSLKVDPMIYEIIDNISADHLEEYVTKLANFGTRHTLSDTLSRLEGLVLPGGGSKKNLRKYPKIAVDVWK